MNKLFLPYEIAMLAKINGFDEPCLLSYRNSDGEEQLIPTGIPKHCKNSDFFIKSNQDNCSAPLYQQALDWLREKHSIHINIYEGHDEDKIWWNAELTKVQLGYNYDPINTDDIGADTYYEVLNKAIKEAIKLI